MFTQQHFNAKFKMFLNVLAFGYTAKMILKCKSKQELESKHLSEDFETMPGNIHVKQWKMPT